MSRVPYLLPTAALCVLALGGCRSEQGRGAEVARDTAPTAAPAGPAVDVAAIPPDTTRHQPGVRDSTPAPREPGTSVARTTRPESTPKPNVFPRRTPAPTPKPQVPKPAETEPAQPTERATGQPQDTGKATAPRQDTAKTAAPQQDTGKAAQTQALRDPYHRPPRDTVSQQVYDGWKQYNLNCARCHGEDVLGSTIAPHLIESVKPGGPIDKGAFHQVVCEGRPAKGMPAWCPLGLDKEKIEAIYAYVKGRSEGKIGPGRPAVRTSG